MIEHNVFIKTRNGVAESAKRDLIAHAKDLETIPGVSRAYAGFNASTESAAAHYDMFLRVYLKSMEAVEVYLRDPVHRNFADEYVHPIKDSITVFDIEI